MKKKSLPSTILAKSLQFNGWHSQNLGKCVGGNASWKHLLHWWTWWLPGKPIYSDITLLWSLAQNEILGVKTWFILPLPPISLKKGFSSPIRISQANRLISHCSNIHCAMKPSVSLPLFPCLHYVKGFSTEHICLFGSGLILWINNINSSSLRPHDC